VTIQHGNLTMLVSLTSTDGDNSVTSSFPLDQTRGSVTDLATLSAMNEQKLAAMQPTQPEEPTDAQPVASGSGDTNGGSGSAPSAETSQ